MGISTGFPPGFPPERTDGGRTLFLGGGVDGRTREGAVRGNVSSGPHPHGVCAFTSCVDGEKGEC